MTITVTSVPKADPEHFKQKFVSAIALPSTAAFTWLLASS